MVSATSVCLFSNGKLRRSGSCSEEVSELQYKYIELSIRMIFASIAAFYIHIDVLNCIKTVCNVFRPAGSCTVSVHYVLDPKSAA
jgi:hypothetical protein